MNNDSMNGNVIHTYSRAEAIADGELVDVSDEARGYGLRAPVALTRAAWGLCVEMSPAAVRAGNDEIGRLRDLLWMLVNAVKRAGDVSEIVFAVRCVTTSVRASLVQLRAVAGPGDDGAPVITVMLPDES